MVSRRMSLADADWTFLILPYLVNLLPPEKFDPMFIKVSLASFDWTGYLPSYLNFTPWKQYRKWPSIAMRDLDPFSLHICVGLAHLIPKVR